MNRALLVQKSIQNNVSTIMMLSLLFSYVVEQIYQCSPLHYSSYASQQLHWSAQNKKIKKHFTFNYTLTDNYNWLNVLTRKLFSFVAEINPASKIFTTTRDKKFIN